MGLSLSATESSSGVLDTLILLSYENSGFTPVSFLSFFQNLSSFQSKSLVIIEPRQITIPLFNPSISVPKLPFKETITEVRSLFNFRPLQVLGCRLWISVPIKSQRPAFVRQIRCFSFLSYRSTDSFGAGQLFSTPAKSVSEALGFSTQSHNLGLLNTNAGPVIIPNQTVNDCDLIIPNVYLGSEKARLNRALLEKLGITHIVSLGTKSVRDSRIQNYEVQLTDSVFEVLEPQFWNAIEFVNEALAEKGVVLIHCRKGISRSPALCIAFLMEKKKYTFEKAVELMTKRRPVVLVNPGFTNQLKEREGQIRMKAVETGCKM
jgi:hypothetical protein